MFRNISVVPVALVLLSSVAIGSENASDDYDIHGRSIPSITADLAEYSGIDANRVEAWGDNIIVHTQDQNGANLTVLVDKNTLRPVADGSSS